MKDQAVVKEGREGMTAMIVVMTEEAVAVEIEEAEVVAVVEKEEDNKSSYRLLVTGYRFI